MWVSSLFMFHVLHLVTKHTGIRLAIAINGLHWNWVNVDDLLVFGSFQDGQLAGTTTNVDTSTAKAPCTTINTEAGKDELIKTALDKLKDSKKSDDEGKGTTNGGEAREEPEAKLPSDTRTETAGDRIKERERDRERERTRARDHDRGRESDRERGRDDYERGRDKVKERVHRSRDKGKDSGQLIYRSTLFQLSYIVHSPKSKHYLNFLTDPITQDAWRSLSIILLEVICLSFVIFSYV